VALRIAEAWRVQLRYDVRALLDSRPSTIARHPNPEHGLWLEIEAAF
jgi:hypothetical protein